MDGDCQDGDTERTVLRIFGIFLTKEYGYGQCSYTRVVTEDKVHCSLVIGKARIAPTKVVTILELTAAVVSSAVSSMFKEELELKINQEYFWTDSLKMKPKEFISSFPVKYKESEKQQTQHNSTISRLTKTQRITPPTASRCQS